MAGTPGPGWWAIPAGRCAPERWTPSRDAGREEQRPLLETALNDAAAWVRWKALRGLAQLGAAPSPLVIQPLTEDRDFRVRLEALAALR